MWQNGRRQKLQSYIAAPVVAHWIAWTLVVLMLTSATGIVCFYWGYDKGLRSVGASAGEVTQLRLGLKQHQNSLIQLNQELATLKQDKDIAIQTAQKLQEDNKNQLASVADMQEQVMLYQRLLGAKNPANTLSIDNVVIRKSADNQYQYRFLLTQLSNNQTNIAGKLTVRVLGTGKNQVLSLAPIDVSFQYFKSMTGTMSLPANFQAESIEITLQAVGKKASKHQKKFKWEVSS